MSKDVPVYAAMIKCNAFCARCAEGVDPILVPATYRKLKCPECGLIHYSTPGIIGRTRGCKQCLRIFDGTWVRLALDDWEAIPAPYICESCKVEVDKFQSEIKKGGVSWYCNGCGSSGVFDAESPISVKLREQEQVLPPASLGVQLQGGCPACSEDAEIPDVLGMGLTDTTETKN